MKQSNNLRIALVHDYIKEYGGAERVLEALHEIWPDAPVFTLVYLPEFLGPHKKRFKNPPRLGEAGWDIRTSFLQYLPFKAKLISPFRIIAPFIFKSFNFSDFDVVIVSATGAYSPNIIQTTINNQQSTINKKIVHICYCHTPPRYLYGYATAREWKNNWVFRILGELANHFLRLVDFKSSQNVDFFIANSKNVKERIKKFYRRDATVIYPPIEIDAEVVHKNFRVRSTGTSSSLNRDADGVKAHSENFVDSPRHYFLAGGRIARPKHIDLIIEACIKAKVPLKIFGRGFGGLNISVSQYPSIEYLGEVSDEEKYELMRNAKAFIFASEDEDFGITPVEAMSVGTTVIAYRSGGVLESVMDGKTGLFFDQLSVESLNRAIKQFNGSKIKPEDCIRQAQKFSKERFKKEIKEFVENVVK